NRVKAVNGAKVSYPAELMDQTWERVLIGVDGASFIDAIELHEPPLGEKHTITAQTASGPIELEGQFAEFDHIDGGLLFWKKPAIAQVTAITMQHSGSILSVARAPQ